MREGTCCETAHATMHTSHSFIRSFHASGSGRVGWYGDW